MTEPGSKDSARALDAVAETADPDINDGPRDAVTYFLTIARARSAVLWATPVEVGKT
ncbi:MAG: hypothetical protein ACR2PK_17090 [Acidimicrobiales bacterium]